jgi:glycosyltransferase involved in cell wall biosynthesis/DNA-binding CsgD family transcriptional regulator
MNRRESDKKNVLIIHQNFPAQFRSIALHLIQQPNVKVIGIGKETAPGIPDFPWIKYKLHRSASKNVHPYNFRSETAVLHGQGVLKVLLHLKERGFEPEVILAHPGWGETLYVKEVFPNAKLIHFCEWYYNTKGADFDFDPEFPSDINARLKLQTTNAFHLLNIQNCDIAISPTEWQKKQFPQIYQQKINVVHEGVPIQVLKPNPLARITLPNGKLIKYGHKVITYVARNLEPYRGFHVFMRTLPKLLEQHPDCEVIIVGGDKVSYGGRPTDAINWRIKMLREVLKNHPGIALDRVHFLGHLPYEIYQVILQISAVHIYLSYPFVLSWSLLEAMATGCAIVASSTAPVKEVIQHGRNGLLVDFFSSNQLMHSINTLLSDRGYAHKLRLEAIKSAQKYSLQNGLKAYLKLMFNQTSSNRNDLELDQNSIPQITLQFNRRKSDKLHNLGLSKKEQQVLKFLMTGMEDRDISLQLQISQKTVNHHVSSIISKLGANNRTHVLAKVYSSEATSLN